MIKYKGILPAGKMKCTQNEKKDANKKRIAAAAVIAVCMIAAAGFLLLTGSFNGQDLNLSLLDFGTVMKGVNVAGIDISGMARQEAIDATAGVPDELLGNISIPIDVNGEMLTFSAEELGLDTDYEDVIRNAISYGHTGALDDRMKSALTAQNGLADFKVTVRAKRENVEAALKAIKEKLDKQPEDASWQFTPSGHYASGAEYDSKVSGQLELIPQDGMPNALLYQYYRTSKFIKGYIPVNSNISRFVYTEEENGLVVDMNPVADSLISAVEKGDYSAITAPVQTPEPQMRIDAVMDKTQLISSWTSSYESHDDAERNFNVAKLSGIINGVIIKPGEVWSVNEEAGPRTYNNGWKGAPGIYKGAFVTEPGGGVCQISSTIYNAALRAGLEIVESSRHSVISNYMPLGLDATISTGGKDLKIKNPYDTPVFIVSYVNKKEKNVTVEFYGPPVIHEKYGPVILNFSSELIERTGMPGTNVHYNASETPDGKPIAPGSSKNFVTARRGTRAQVYIHYISPDGKELGKEKLYVAVYPKIEGEKYVNGPPPGD